MTEAEKKEKVNELMNKISFALEDDILAQGFEIICKELAELGKENERMKGILFRNDESIKTLNDIKNQKCFEIEELKKENEDLEKIRSGQVKIMESDLTRIEKLKKENEQLKTVCDYNCPVHELATHNACLTCPAVRNSPHHDLKNVIDEELQKIIKDAEAEMEM